MSNSVIKLKGISKQYRLGQVEPYKTLRDSVTNLLTSPIRRFRQGLPFRDLPISTIWALKEVSFDVKCGEVVGVIGKNGSGKSTLLKILSRITDPTEGQCELYGCVGSLLEVGTGFHPELTGRENVFLNGAIMGMRKAEIVRQFDQIVSFAEIDQFIDTPVKRYSSGMYMRLAFAVAAHLEPEILLIDEVLAVGDSAFQAKCLGRMQELGTQGRTVLFVSHNMGAVTSLCSRGILLDRGNVVFDGSASEAASLYVGNLANPSESRWTGNYGDYDIRVLSTWVAPVPASAGFITSADLEVGIEIDVLKPVTGLIVGFWLWSQFEYELAYVLHDDCDSSPAPSIQPGVQRKIFRIPANTLSAGNYRIGFDVGIHNVRRVSTTEGTVNFALENIEGLGRRFSSNQVRGYSALFRPDWAEK